MNPEQVSRSLPLATILVTLVMLLGSMPSAELAAAATRANTTTTTTETVQFSETFIHQSRETLADVTLVDWGGFGRFTPDSDYCYAIQAYWSSWDCRDAEATWSSVGNACWGGCYLEYEKYTLELEVVYSYKFQYSGSVTYDTTTEWSDTGQPQTTVELTDSTENIIVSAKAYLDLSIKRYFDGPNNAPILRQTVINKEFPYISPTDIDSGGGGFRVGQTTFYAWDNYVSFDSLYATDGLGTKHELDGYIGLATVELLSAVSKYFSSRGMVQYSKPLDALNYFIDVDFGLYLDLEVDLWNRAQFFLGMMSPSAIGSIYSSTGVRSAYNCRLPTSGTMSGPSSAQSCEKGVSGSGDDMYGRLGFRHSVSTKESYSISLVIHAGQGRWASTIWNWIMPQSSYQFQLSAGWLPTTSSRAHYTMTTASAFIGTAPAPPPPNSAPTISMTDTGGSTSTIFTSVGQAVQLSVSTNDADGDSLGGMISWDDGNTTNSLPSSASHTYASAGDYEIVGVVSDGMATTYSTPIRVIVTPQNSALQALSISVDNLMITEGDTATFTMSSSNPGASFQFVFSDGMSTTEVLPAPSGELASTQRQVTYNAMNDFTPNIAAYDSDWNLIGYDEVELTVLPDFGNGSIDPSLFEIIGDEILVVIDDDGRELSTMDKTDWWAEVTYRDDLVTSNNSQVALLEALNTVSQIRGVDMDYFRVGDTNLDGTIDTAGANGPGLSILRHYSTVIWTTGYDYAPLSDWDEAILQTYAEAGGALILFSQDYLYGADAMQTDWAEGTFARDVLGVGSSIQDSGHPSSNRLQGSDGEGLYNTEYLPLAGLDLIDIVQLENNEYQDHISKNVRYGLLPEWHNFESSSIHGSSSVYGAQNGTTYGPATTGWRTWSYWQRDCSTSSPWSVTGSCSAKTAAATHNNMKQLLADVPASSTMTTVQFDLKVSSEPTYDFLSFSVDSQEVQRWSGSVGWTQFSHTLSPGSHVLEWAYVKDSSGSTGSDAAWIDNVYICCDTGVEDQPRTLEILSDGQSNYGLATMIEDGGRVAFISLDPVQIVKNYDLETMMLQLIDWAENDWTFDTSADANTIPMGVDGTHPSPTISGGESWFDIRLFEGQRIEIETSLINPGIADFDIGDLTVYDPDGVQVQGTSNSSDAWYIEYTAQQTGVHQVLVDVDLVGTAPGYQPWYAFSMHTLTDSNTFDDSLDDIGALTVDGGVHHDALTPLGWYGSNVFDFKYEYSTSGYHIGNLTAGEYRGLSITSADDYEGHDIAYVFIDFDLAKKLSRQASNGENDNDGDGIPDDLDPDDDDDGVDDEFDPTPHDRDDDGIDDADDDDDDGNGIDDDDEVILEEGNLSLAAGEELSGIFSFDEDVELAFGIANMDVGIHPLLATFGYDIEIWSVPSDDASDLAAGTYPLTEDLEESFWVSAILDSSDVFTVDVAWDEEMILHFQADAAVVDATANISCDGGAVTQVTLGQYTDLEIDCDAPHATATIEISTDTDLLRYTLLYERDQAIIEIVQNQPMFGINQVPAGLDFWSLANVGGGQLMDINGDVGGVVRFYDRLGQTVLSRDVDDAGLISIPSTATLFDVSGAGEYEFIVIDPDAHSISASEPSPVILGQTFSIEVSVAQHHSITERTEQMWTLPSANFTISSPSHPIVAVIEIDDDATGNGLMSANISIDSSDLGIGVHTLTLTVDSTWTGPRSIDLELVVEDDPNTPPTISGPESLTFGASDIAQTWSYVLFDVDGDDMTLTLIEGPPEMEVDGTAWSVTWPPAEVGNYTVIVEVDDGRDTARFTTLIEVTAEPPPVEDIPGCTNETATNHDPLATLNDGSCVFPEDPIEEEEEEEEEGGTDGPDGSDPPPTGAGNDQDSKKSKSSDSDHMLLIAGSAILLVALLALTTLMVLRRRGDKDPLIHQEEMVEAVWDAQPQVEAPAMMPAPIPMAVAPEPVRPIAAPAPQVEGPSRANSYLDLVGGGVYTKDERGTIYTDLNGSEWVQLADGSFVRLN